MGKKEFVSLRFVFAFAFALALCTAKMFFPASLSSL